VACTACATVPDLDRYMLTPERAPSGPKAVAIDGPPARAGNLALPLVDGKQTYAQMKEAIRGARQHVHMEMYIFEDDEVGHDFAKLLVERARAGVKVRLIYDSVGSIKTSKDFFQELERGGVQVAEFNPVSPGIVLKGPVGMQARDHRKLLLVDGHVAFLGGINISRVYGTSSASRPGGGSGGMSGGKDAKSGEDEKPWRDMQIRLEGPVVADLQRAFVAQWEKWKKEKLPEAGLYPKLAPAGPHEVTAVASSPDGKGVPDMLYLALVAAIDAAKKEVWITNAYFVPHPQLIEALSKAARRGVDVRLVLPSHTDSAVVYHAGRAHYEPLLDAGVKIFERKERLLHAKTAVVDGEWSTIGSTNLDWRSLAYNDELNAVVHGTDFGMRMRAIFERDIAASDAITPQKWSQRPITDRIKEAGASAFSEML
jgi:cardiolipin synthase